MTLMRSSSCSPVSSLAGLSLAAEQSSRRDGQQYKHTRSCREMCVFPSVCRESPEVEPHGGSVGAVRPQRLQVRAGPAPPPPGAASGRVCARLQEVAEHFTPGRFRIQNTVPPEFSGPVPRLQDFKEKTASSRFYIPKSILFSSV